MSENRQADAGLNGLARARKAMLADFRGDLSDPATRESVLESLRLADDAVTAELGANGAASDGALGELIGLGESGTSSLGNVHVPEPSNDYDDQVTAERFRAVGDLYYLYQNEVTGVFRAVCALKGLFDSGSVRLSDGEGAFGLYRFDRREVLRFSARERHAAYRRVFGYGRAKPPAGAQPNDAFHRHLVEFNCQVAQFFRDRRISEVVRQRASDPSFGSIAIVRRSGLDLRNNVKMASYGNVQVLRLEGLQLLEETFRILGASDVRQLFGAENAWEVIEDIHERYLGIRQIHASARGRLARAGRTILRWLGDPNIQETRRTNFEILLELIADDAEEWLSSAETLRAAQAAGAPSRPTRSRPALTRVV